MDSVPNIYEFGAYKVTSVNGSYLQFEKNPSFTAHDSYDRDVLPSGYILLIVCSVISGFAILSKQPPEFNELIGFFCCAFPFGILLPISLWRIHAQSVPKKISEFKVNANTLTITNGDDTTTEQITRSTLYRPDNSRLKITTGSHVFVTDNFGSRRNAKKALTLIRSLAPNREPNP